MTVSIRDEIKRHQDAILYHEACENISGTYGSFDTWRMQIDHHRTVIKNLTSQLEGVADGN